VNDLYIAGFRNDLRSEPGFDARNWAAAAQFCANNKINLEEALTWADYSLNPANGGQEDFNNLSIKASVLMGLNRGQEAGVLMDKAIRHPSATVPAIHQYGRTLLNLGMKEKALEVFQYNAKTHPEEKFTTFVGLARGYTAVGNKKEAIKNWEVALKNVPANQTANRPVWEAELNKLKESK
jgi:tetratricopeptide (TPR) repeat protein